MTDVRAILERESRSLRWRTVLTVAFGLVWGAFLLWVGFNRLQKGLTVGNLIGAAAPLFGLSCLAVNYSSRHRRALEAVIEDPDPALDPHFSAALDADDEEIRALARRSFLVRFSDRQPAIGDADWRRVVSSLPEAADDEAESLLSLIESSATLAAIPALEAFAKETTNERLRTAARTVLGNLRLRLERETVSSTAQEAVTRQEDQFARLRL